MEKVPHFEDLPIMTANLVISVRELTKRISDLEKKIVSLDPEQLALKPKHKPLTSREVCQLIHKYGFRSITTQDFNSKSSLHFGA